MKEGWKQIGKETGQVNINKDPVLVSLSSLRNVVELFDTGTELLPPPLDGGGKKNKKLHTIEHVHLQLKYFIVCL